VLRRHAASLLTLGGYVAFSFACFGWRLLPHPGRVILGRGPNPSIYIWSFGWWEHAFTTFTNPFVPHVIYAPSGVDLAWTPSAPGLASVFAPLTALVGPVASYNAAMLLMPAVSAWTGYLLCRYLTGSVWAAVVGGYLFGFSTASLRQIQPGNLNLAAVFLFPLIALVVVRFLRGELQRRALVWQLGVLLAFQLTISTEFAAEVTGALIVSLGCGYLLVADLRARIRSSVPAILCAYGVGALIVAPFTYYLLSDFHSSTIVGNLKPWGTDALGFVVPSFVNGVGGTSLASLEAHVPSRSAYLGLPTLIIVAAYAVRCRSSTGARFLVTVFGAAAALTLGVTLTVYGHELMALPWWLAATHIPALDDALPFRLAVFVSLVAGVIVAIWIATARGRIAARPVVLPVLAVIALVPAVWQTSNPFFTPQKPDRVAFFTDGIYKACVARGEVLAAFPFDGRALIWQAESGFWFSLAADGIQPFPKNGAAMNAFDRDSVVWDLVYSGGRPTIPRILAFVGAHRVGLVLSVPAGGFPSRAQMTSLGSTELLGGVLVAPSCGLDPLTTRDLSGYVSHWGGLPTADRPNVGWCRNGAFLRAVEGLEPSGDPADVTQAIFVSGEGLTCSPPPAGYKRRGFATQGVPAGVYPYYAP
jgi:hypothetical protein